MKKILATALAAVLICGSLPLAAFASYYPYPDYPPRSPYPTDKEPLDYTHRYENYVPQPSLELHTGDVVLDESKVANFGDIVLGKDAYTLDIKILASGFGVSDMDITDDVINDLRIVFTDQATANLFPIIHKFAYKDHKEAHYILSPQNIGLAKGEIYVVSDYYSALYGYEVRSAPIPINGRIIDPTINKAIKALTGKNLAAEEVKLNGKTIAASELDDLGVVYSGSRLTFKLDTDFFVWEPDISGMNSMVRKSTMVANQVRPFVMYRQGRNIIEEVIIENIGGRAYVVVNFKEDFPYLDEQDFEFDLYLSLRGDRYSDEYESTMVTVYGSVMNEIIYVSDDDELADLSAGGVMVEAEGACKNTQIHLGAGLYVFQNLIGGNRYYGRATDARTAGDIEIMNFFPDIKKVFTITSLKGISTTSHVGLDVLERDEYGEPLAVQKKEPYYVYDADGDFIGMSNEYLPMRTKYYLAEKELDFEEGEFNPPEEEFDGDWDEPGTANNNANPKTGLAN